MNRNLVVTALLAVLIAAVASCNDDSGKVLLIRVDAGTANMTVDCVDEFELTFRGTGTTQITGSSNGTWREGGVTYRTEGDMFAIFVSGDYIRAKRSPHQFELPLRNVSGRGTFEVRGYWRYNGFDTGTAQGTLELPDSDSIYIVTIIKNPLYQANLCPTTAPPDADVTPEEVEEAAEQEGEELGGIEAAEKTEVAEEAESVEAADQVEAEETD